MITRSKDVRQGTPRQRATCLSTALILTFVALASIVSVVPIQAQQPATSPSSPRNVDTLAVSDFESLTTSLLEWHRDALRSFYAAREWRAAWLSDGKPTSQALRAIEFLSTASNHGLQPADYASGEWRTQLSALPGLSARERTMFDLRLSTSVVRMISDLQVGRVDPRVVGFEFDTGRDRLALDQILAALVEDPSAGEAFTAMEPPYPGYQRLKVALAQYRELEPKLRNIRLTEVKKVESGDDYVDTPQLALLLETLGDMPSVASTSQSSTTYDEELVAAIKRFQSRHGLDVDGTIGSLTFKALNTPIAYRIRQIELTMERWRWVPESITFPYVVVNLPEFRLRAYDEEGEASLTMRVVVGKAALTPTPVTTGNLEQVVFQPYWNVPRSILTKEILPKLDGGYLGTSEMEIIDPAGKVVPLDDSSFAGLRQGTHRIRQRPGTKNALGPVKFDFRNIQAIFLHGTPAQSLFGRSRRDFSHGCIRLENPGALALWLLRDQPQWTVLRVENAMAGGETTNVKITRKTRILLVYGTAVVRLNGEAEFFEDIYGMDARLDTALSQRRVPASMLAIP